MFRKASEVQNVLEFSGTPEAMGRQHGELLKDRIANNIRILINDKPGMEETLKSSDIYRRWVDTQLEFISREWPWLLAEMESMSRASGLAHEDILNLNFSAWQVAGLLTDVAQAEAAQKEEEEEEEECACLIMTIKDGTYAIASTLDDSARIWAGPVRRVPDSGYSSVSICFPGKVVGGRGVNSKGLSLGTAGQGIVSSSMEQKLSAREVPGGFALRAMNQTCADVKEVIEFCRQYRFNGGLVCVDSSGDILCAHQTPAGLMEVPVEKKYQALGNSIADDRLIYLLYKMGYKYRNPEQPTSRFRRGRLLAFAESRNGKCTLEEIAEFLGARDDGDLGSIHNSRTVVITLGNPQNNRNSVLIKEPNNRTCGEDFLQFSS